MWKVNTLPRTGPELNDKGFFLKTCEYPPGAITYEPGNDQNIFFFFSFLTTKSSNGKQRLTGQIIQLVVGVPRFQV